MRDIVADDMGDFMRDIMARAMEDFMRDIMAHHETFHVGNIAHHGGFRERHHHTCYETSPMGGVITGIITYAMEDFMRETSHLKQCRVGVDVAGPFACDRFSISVANCASFECVGTIQS